MIAAFPFSDVSRKPEEKVQERKVAELMIASVRKAMPAVEIVQMTDKDFTEDLPVDRVLRKAFNRPNWVPWMYEFLSEIPGEVLFLDSDIIVQRDLSPMFLTGADVTLTSRGPKTVEGRQMPFLIGVVASKAPSFWLEAAERVAKMEDQDDRDWWGSQVVLFDMWMDFKHGSLPWKMSAVDADIHNYVPQNENDLPKDKWVLHFKGKKRKAWMLKNFSHLVTQKEAA
jgi:hypothetical protein